ncbi:hypothetical protein F6455_07040 [Proteobacteria bacterium 005FR1]|nr:hypothetical protein [Proteobacteria bacterium 005FR1]
MSKASVLISSLVVLAVVGGFAYWVLSTDDNLVPIPAADEGVRNNSPKAIANRWQWENFTGTQTATVPAADDENPKAEKPRPTGEVPFDVVMIYNVLQSIQLDDNGRLVPDLAAKKALEKAYDDLGSDVSPKSFSELQELIRIGLPGAAGEEAARVLEDYYQLRSAEEEFNRQVEKQLASDANTEQNASTERYEELMQLRRRYLGHEIADQLYAMENAQARHMFATMEIQQNADLTDEQKQSQLQALQQKLNDRLLALGEMTPEQVAADEVERLREDGASSEEIYSAREELLGPVKAQELAAADREEARWQSRFDGFWQARENVMQAALDEAEKERQVEQLLAQYFSPEELERARLTSYQRETRDQE